MVGVAIVGVLIVVPLTATVSFHAVGVGDVAAVNPKLTLVVAFWRLVGAVPDRLASTHNDSVAPAASVRGEPAEPRKAAVVKEVAEFVRALPEHDSLGADPVVVDAPVTFTTKAA